MIGRKGTAGTYLLPDWEGLGLGEVAYYSVKKGRLKWEEEVLGL